MPWYGTDRSSDACLRYPSRQGVFFVPTLSAEKLTGFAASLLEAGGLSRDEAALVA